MKYLKAAVEGRKNKHEVNDDENIVEDANENEEMSLVSKKSYKLPLVRLDIDILAGGVTSALAGVMNQPNAEKICTLQVNFSIFEF
jgi:hypothetical protein